jgi:hypothetical protein
VPSLLNNEFSTGLLERIVKIQMVGANYRVYNESDAPPRAAERRLPLNGWCDLHKKGHVSYTTIDTDCEQGGNIKLTEKQRGQLHNARRSDWEVNLRRKKIGKRFGGWLDHCESDPAGEGEWRTTALTGCRTFGGGSSMQLQEMER